ncbi:ABC transporter permease [Candidatus Bathyarchaeota archaeon]|nr:ABC transporter permease [Candidatus Bathyarchaeota archaeon]
MLIVAISGATKNYVTVIKEMSLFYSGSVVVVARGSIFVQAIPVGGFLQENMLEELRTVEGVKKAVPMIFILGSSENEGVIQIVPSNITVGIPVGNWSVLTGSIPLKPGGSWPSAGSSGEEVVIGPSLSLKYSLSIGSEIKIDDTRLMVTGILDAPTSSAIAKILIVMPLSTAQEVYHYQRLISMVVVDPLEGVTEEELSKRIESKVVGVRALTGDDRNGVVEPILQDMELWSLGIGSAVSSIDMVLVMVVSVMNVTERRRELATLDAIGVPRSSTVRLVVTETGLIGLFGSILGIPLGIITALLMVHFYTQLPVSLVARDIFIHVPPVMALEILAVTVALSCIAGLIPAMIVTRKSVVELIRSEY